VLRASLVGVRRASLVGELLLQFLAN
jgi:hypothetical protein